MFSLLFVLRMIAATLPLAVMLSVTQISDLSGMLVEKLRVPYKYVFALTTSMRFIPSFAAEPGDIMAAQTARGVDFDTRNIFRKIRLILPLCVPLLISSVARIDRGAISAELRGFSLRRRGASYKSYHMKWIDWGRWPSPFALVALAASFEIQRNGVFCMQESAQDRRLMMGNEAIALGATPRGRPVCLRLSRNALHRDPGRPPRVQHSGGHAYVEWSTNEKAALEAAAGAAYAGARAMVTMKQVGLQRGFRPADEPRLCGRKGRHGGGGGRRPRPHLLPDRAGYPPVCAVRKAPVFDPASPRGSYRMIADALNAPKSTIRRCCSGPPPGVCHGCASVALLPPLEVGAPEGFRRDPGRWVIFPRLSYQNHLLIEARNPKIGDEFSALPYNEISVCAGCPARRRRRRRQPRIRAGNAGPCAAPVFQGRHDPSVSRKSWRWSF